MRLTIFLAFLLVLAGPARAAPDYAELNRALADGAVIPAYRAFAEAAGKLAETTKAWCKSPSAEGRTETRAAFRVAMLAWQRARPVVFGPAATDSRQVRIQFWPDRRGTAARQLRRALRTRDPALTAPGGIEGRSVALQGLPAFETLIVDHPDDEYACAFASEIAAYLDETAELIVAEWTDDDGFRNMLTPPPNGNALYATAKEASTDFFKSLSTALDSIVAQKLEAPLGSGIDGASPRQAESWRSELALAAIAANLETLETWFAVPGGFRDQLAKAGAAALGDGMKQAFREAAAETREIPMPLSRAVADPAQRPKVEALLTSVRDLRVLVRDVAARELGLVVGFNSLDGD